MGGARMPNLDKYFLLTVDESEESLRPISFLAGLYPQPEQLHVLICHFYAPLPPVYQEQSLAPAMAVKKDELVRVRQEKAAGAMRQAREKLMKMGVVAENIHEYMQERSVSLAQHSCSLAGIKRVDAVVVQKATGGKLADVLKSDPIPAHLAHCLSSPIWFLEGHNIDTGRGVICMYSEQASLRAVRHAASMLAASDTRVDLFHCDPKLKSTVACGIEDMPTALSSWERTPDGQKMSSYLQEAQQILLQGGISADRIRIVIHPVSGDVPSTILNYCRQNQIGIAVLGHSKAHGIWSFFQNSVTKTILAAFRNMTIWVVQQRAGDTDEDPSC